MSHDYPTVHVSSLTDGYTFTDLGFEVAVRKFMRLDMPSFPLNLLIPPAFDHDLDVRVSWHDEWKRIRVSGLGRFRAEAVTMFRCPKCDTLNTIETTKSCCMQQRWVFKRINVGAMKATEDFWAYVIYDRSEKNMLSHEQYKLLNIDHPNEVADGYVGDLRSPFWEHVDGADGALAALYEYMRRIDAYGVEGIPVSGEPWELFRVRDTELAHIPKQAFVSSFEYLPSQLAHTHDEEYKHDDREARCQWPNVFYLWNDECDAKDVADDLSAEWERALCGYPFSHGYVYMPSDRVSTEHLVEAGFLVYEFRGTRVAGIDGGGVKFGPRHFAKLYALTAEHARWPIETDVGDVYISTKKEDLLTRVWVEEFKSDMGGEE